MSLQKEKRDEIKKYILEQIYNDKSNFITATEKTWGISRTSINRYIEEMLREGILEKSDKKKSGYDLVDLVHKEYHYVTKQRKLEEDIIYSDDIVPILPQFPRNVEKIWYYAFCEIMNNAIEHSNADNIYILVRSNVLFTRIFIMDDGVGIFNKIKEYVFETEKLDITLEEAMSILRVGKMTTCKENHSGEGIFFTSRSMDGFRILSSDLAFIHDAYDANASLDIKEKSPNSVLMGQKGTCVLMDLWNNTKRELKEVFDMFSSDEKGFYKTSIPIKWAIPTGFPVSRSQARRLCSGFDKFEEVELDFSDVEDIGQAFAHEIFIVFQNKHPEVKIRTKNTNQNVESMINRVKNTSI